MKFPNAIREIILAGRIKKAVSPMIKVSSIGTEMYLDMIKGMLNESLLIINAVGPIIEKNADSIAKAIILLEPAFKEMKENLVLSTSTERMTTLSDNIANRYSDVLKSASDEVASALKIEEEDK